MSIESPILVHLPSFCSKVASLFKYPSMAIRLASSKYFSSSKPPSSLYPVPDMANDSPDGKTTFFNVCSFTVNVPVLSVAITVQLPRDSTAFNFLTMTFCLAIRIEPMVSANVNANGSPSGIADTESAMTDNKISWIGKPLLNSKINKTAAIHNTKIQICFEN